MTISMYDASVPVFKQMLTSLIAILAKTEAHATQRKIEPQALLQARLFPDMFSLTRQVQIAGDFAKGACARLAGVEVPKYEDTEVTFADLQARLTKTIAFIEQLPKIQIVGSEDREINTSAGANSKKFDGKTYLTHYALPQFFFHTTTVYAILRHNGVDIGKKDYVGSF
jgi:hypothetical protein